MDNFQVDDPSQEKVVNKILNVIWTLGLIIPVVVLFVNPQEAEYLVPVMESFFAFAVFALISRNLFKMRLKYLGLASMLLVNAGLCFITIQSPVFFGSTPYWFAAAITLTLFISGFKAGLFFNRFSSC